MKTLHIFALFVISISLGAGCTSQLATRASTKFEGSVGLQLYSLRGQFTRNVPETVAKVQGFGITEVELAGTYNLKPSVFKKLLTEAKLKPIAGHYSFDRFRKNPQALLDEGKELGLSYIGTAWVKGNEDFTPDDALKTAKILNKAGEIFSQAGIKAYYHCHGYEFKVLDNLGRTPMDILIQETDPRYVTFEMDILWVQFPGQDPATWLRKYPDRWAMLHLKDLKKGVVTGDQGGGTDPNNDVTLGTGQMNWPKILKAAKEVGVKHYFIEDESARSVEQVPASLTYLRTVTW